MFRPMVSKRKRNYSCISKLKMWENIAKMALRK
jgi:hypothetical protein